MWTTIIALLETTLKIVQTSLVWQIALTKLNARRLAKTIDDEQLAKGRDLLLQIDAAKSAGNLAAVSLLLDDAANNALYVANIRSALPDVSGPDLGLGSGIPTAPASGGGADHGAQPDPGANAGCPVVVVPRVPYSCTGEATWWGRNPDGSNDKGDVDTAGKDLLGAFGDNNHNEQIIGASIPVIMFQQTIGRTDSVYKAVADRQYTFDVLSHVTGKHLSGVWLTDLGPAARLSRPLDLTYAANRMLGHTNGTNLCTFWITGPDGKTMPIKGWDFEKGQVAA